MSKETKNSNLASAKKNKNDEFYTQLSDIEKELIHYKNHFENKIVFCNCDDPKESNFFQYFALNFTHLGLKKLITTHYEKDSQSYKLVVEHDINKDGVINLDDAIRTDLKGDGDFRSQESIEILKEADIIVTNPPFSLFREYIAQLMEHDKKFLVIGNINAISYKETFKYIKENKLWLGYKTVRFFNQPDGSLFETARTFWFTNLDHKKRHENLLLYKTYKGNESDYPKYDNYDAIEVSKTKDIPMDYEGAMGVPITFLDKFNPEQFEIIGMAEDNGKGFSGGIWDGDNPHCVIKGQNKFKRLFIQHKKAKK
ncbi:MAG: modification methylase [Flavobacteria bacterium RIFCSPLOWO2_12_FULL_35_11]|nr:MAG: modification methylase [Flavobacteria bacterium RIFCSPLOWO2_12_FULL_35_11]